MPNTISNVDLVSSYRAESAAQLVDVRVVGLDALAMTIAPTMLGARRGDCKHVDLGVGTPMHPRTRCSGPNRRCSTQDLGTAGHVMVFGGVYGPPMATATGRRIVRTWQGFGVEAGETQYMFACPVSRDRMPDVTVNGPIRYAIDSKGRYSLQDDSGNECQAALLGKRLLSASPVNTPTARMYDSDGRVADLSFTWDGSGHGKLSGKLPIGESLSGEYSTIAGADNQHRKATLVGDKGSLIECEYSVSPANHGYGERRDQNHKSYRFQF